MYLLAQCMLTHDLRVRYVFLVERAHVLRAPFVERMRDWIWVAGLAVTVCGLGGIVVVGSICEFVLGFVALFVLDDMIIFTEKDRRDCRLSHREMYWQCPKWIRNEY